MRGRATVILVHVFANALLLWLFYRWLGLDESNNTRLVGSFALVAIILIGFAWLHGFALAQFSGLSPRHAASRGLTTLLPLTLVCLAALAIYALFAWVQAKYSQPAFVVASFLTLHLRKAIPPASVQSVFHFILLVFEWCLVPAALLRLAANIVRRAARNRNKVTRSFPLFALLAAALLICAVWVPLKLFYWVPNVTSFSGQLASLVLRVGLGYLLCVSAALLLDFVTVSGSPADTQPSTVPSP